MANNKPPKNEPGLKSFNPEAPSDTKAPKKEAPIINRQSYRIELGALAECPVWESHTRGKNWCASITPDPKSPGGLSRAFWERAKGDYFYLLPDSPPTLGTVLEFGADSYSAGGRKSPKRRYCVVTACSVESLDVVKFTEASNAFTYAKAL
jgi:hypothetical protein